MSDGRFSVSNRSILKIIGNIENRKTIAVNYLYFYYVSKHLNRHRYYTQHSHSLHDE